jgi:hypothetical protein
MFFFSLCEYYLFQILSIKLIEFPKGSDDGVLHFELQNYWVFLLCPTSGILEIRKHSVSETGSVSFLRSLVQWLRLALSKGPNWVGVFPPSPADGNRSNFRNVVFCSF